MQKINTKAFTLIELLVVISMITIMAVGITNINFNNISHEKNLDRHIIKIVAYLETIRNNSLLGKGIGVSLDVPNSYILEFSLDGGGEISGKTEILGITSDLTSIEAPIFSGSTINTIKSISCNKIDGRLDNSIGTGTGIIIFEGSQLSLTGACNQSSSKILQLEIERQAHTKVIEINTVNGLINIID